MQKRDIWVKCTNVSHSVYSFICTFLTFNGNPVGLLGFLAYFVYQLLDFASSKDYSEVVGDFKEFVAGAGLFVVYYAVKMLGVQLP
ncbi:MAG: hypothetical protein QXT64_07915 [Desulfurococcaceae archaeon]